MIFEIAPPLNFSRHSPFVKFFFFNTNTHERIELIEPRQQPTFIIQRLFCKKDDADCFPKEWTANNKVNATTGKPIVVSIISPINDISRQSSSKASTNLDFRLIYK